MANIIINGVTKNLDTELKQNKVTSVSSSSTDTQYPSAKILYDSLVDKVDKIDGKGLSTNDYTTAEQTKLAGIATGAEVNVQSNWNESDSTSDAYIQNKPTIPTKTSDLTNDSGFLTSHQSLSAYRTSADQDTIDAGKINEPTTEGTSGQVLSTDGDGGRSWITVSGGGGADTDVRSFLTSGVNYTKGDFDYVLDMSNSTAGVKVNNTKQFIELSTGTVDITATNLLESTNNRIDVTNANVSAFDGRITANTNNITTANTNIASNAHTIASNKSAQDSYNSTNDDNIAALKAITDALNYTVQDATIEGVVYNLSLMPNIAKRTSVGTDQFYDLPTKVSYNNVVVVIP